MELTPDGMKAIGCDKLNIDNMVDEELNNTLNNYKKDELISIIGYLLKGDKYGGVK